MTSDVYTDWDEVVLKDGDEYEFLFKNPWTPR